MERIQIRPNYYETKLKDGQLKKQEWYDNEGNKHRDNGAAEIIYKRDGDFSYIGTKKWYKHGTHYKTVTFDQYGTPITERYYAKCDKSYNEYHRLDGPAYIKYNEDGLIFTQIWYVNGLRHRTDGPAVICYNEDGTIEKESYYLDGKLIKDTLQYLLLTSSN